MQTGLNDVSYNVKTCTIRKLTTVKIAEHEAETFLRVPQ